MGKMIRRLGMILCALTLCGAGELFAQGDPLEREAEEQVARKRFEWFYSQRAFPGTTLEEGYMIRALEQDRKNRMVRRNSVQSFFSWTPIGPNPGSYGNYGNLAGRLTGMVGNPLDPSILYISAADGGVWKSVDAGASWTPMTDYVGTLASGSIAIDPVNPDILYFGTGEPYYSGDAYGGIGLLKSTDAGATWFSSGLTLEKRIPRLAIDPTNTATVFAATWGGVYRSSDAGANWSKVLFAGNAYDVVIDASNPANVYAGIGDNSANAGVWKSVDTGKTFVKLAGGLPASSAIQRVRVAVAPSSPSTLYALMSAVSPSGGLRGMFKSTDEGTTWTDANGGGDLDGIFGSAGSSGQGWYDIAVVVSPTNPNLVFASGIDTWRSTNGGASWANVTNGYAGGNVHVDHHNLTYHGSDLYLCTDGGIWKTTNAGSTWINLNNNICAIQFYDVSTDVQTPSRFYGGTQDNGTQRTAGTLSWADVLGGDGGMSAVDYTNSNKVYAERQNGDRNRSTNGGTSWLSMNNGIGSGPWVTPIIIHPTIPSTLFSSADDGFVYISTNSGVSWAKSSVSTPASGTAVTFLAYHPTTGILYASASNRLCRSTNNGQNWLSSVAGGAITDIEFDPANSQVVFVTLSGTGSVRIQRTTNNGTNWTNVSGDLPRIPVNAIKVQPGNSQRMYIGTDIGIYITSNGGTTWAKETTFPDVAVIDLEFTSDGYLVAATHGRGAWKAALFTGISGFAYEDADGNDGTPADQTPSAGWNVKLMSGGLVVDSVTTGAGGDYAFNSIADGAYQIVLGERQGWKGFDAVAGSGGTSELQDSATGLTVVVSNGQVSSGNNFLTYKEVTVRGIAFADLNGDGLKNGADSTMRNQTIRITGSVVHETMTLANGSYLFTGVPPGYIELSESLAAGWTMTVPPGNLYADTVVSGDSIVVNFGNFVEGTVSGLVFRDSDQDGVHDVGEPPLESWKVVLTSLSEPAESTLTLDDGTYTFTGVGAGEKTLRVEAGDDGWGQTVPLEPGTITILPVSGDILTGNDFGFFPLDSVMYRTASLPAWAFAVDGKGKYKSVKKKADKVDVSFRLTAPSAGPQLSLEFSMDVTGTITNEATSESLAAFSGKKVGPFSLSVASGAQIIVSGRGNKGKLVKTKYLFAGGAKTTVASYLMNQPRLPMPNLHNLGEELYIQAGGFTPSGLLVGLGGAHSVNHPKYKDVQKSLNKKGTTHTGVPACLGNFTSNGKPILTQQKSLPPDKHNNALLAELVALKLNVRASQLERTTAGLGDLIYESESTAVSLNGLTVARILAQADSFMSHCAAIAPANATAAEYFEAIHAVNLAFDGPVDTLGFAIRTVLTPVKYLAEVPFLRPNPDPSPRTVLLDDPMAAAQPEMFELHQNYPNPFNPSTTIEITLEEESFVTIAVYDILGREVAVVADGELVDEGTSEFVFDGSNLSSGLYFYRLTARGVSGDSPVLTDMKRMVLVK